MSSSELRRKKETLEGVIRYHRLLLTPTFKKQLLKRKNVLKEKIYHLRYIAQDCQDWKSSDLESIKRGMEISVLKYRLAKELAEEAREVLDDMLSNVYPYLSDARGLEEKVWEVFDNEECSESDETERHEAEKKLKRAGFVLPKLPVKETEQTAAEEPERFMDEVDLDALLNRETAFVNQQTENLLAILKEKKIQLENLRELDDVENKSFTDDGGSD